MHFLDQQKLDVLNSFFLGFIKDFRNLEQVGRSPEDSEQYAKIKEGSSNLLADMLPEIVKGMDYDCVVGSREEKYFQEVNNCQFARLDLIYLIELLSKKLYSERLNGENFEPQIIQSHEDYHRIYGMLFHKVEEIIKCTDCKEIRSTTDDIINYLDVSNLICQIEKTNLENLQDAPYPLFSLFSSNMSAISKLFKKLLLYKYTVETDCFRCQFNQKRNHSFNLANFPEFYLWSLIWPNELTYTNIMLVAASVPLYISRKRKSAYYRLKCIILKKNYSYQIYIENKYLWSAGKENYHWIDLLKKVLLVGKWAIDGLLYEKCSKNDGLALQAHALKETEFKEIEKYAYACDVYELKNRSHIQDYLVNEPN